MTPPRPGGRWARFPRVGVFLHRRRRDTRDLVLAFVARSPWHRLRILTARRFGASIGDGVILYRGFEIRGPSRLTIGDRCTIGDRAVLDARGGLTLGSDVNFSTEVHVWTAQHDWRSDDFAYETKPVTIESHAWLGPRVTVLPGAHIGRGARVAAGAVVHGRLEPNTLYGGVPAAPLGVTGTEFTYRLPRAQDKPWWR